MGDYHVLMQFDIDAEPEVVRRALDTEEGIRAWWSKRTDLDGSGLLVSFPDQPQPFEFEVRDGDGQLDWVTGAFPPWWKGTTIRWVVAEPRETRHAAALLAPRLRPGQPGHPDHHAGLGADHPAAQGLR